MKSRRKEIEQRCLNTENVKREIFDLIDLHKTIFSFFFYYYIIMLEREAKKKIATRKDVLYCGVSD